MPEQSTRPKTFTGRGRRRTSPMVRWVDRLARWIIALGGIGTIGMVSLVCIFLVAVVVPLFRGGSIGDEVKVPFRASAATPVEIGVDEYRTMGWALYADGKLRCFRLSSGESLGAAQEVKGEGEGNGSRLTSWSFAPDSENCVFGFQDGSLRTGSISFKTKFVSSKAVGEAFRNLKIGDTAAYESGVVTRTPEDQLRAEQLELTLDPAIEAASKSAVVRVAFTSRPDGPLICAHSEDGTTTLRIVSRVKNAVTEEITQDVETVQLPTAEGPREPPVNVAVSGLGDNVIVIWRDGQFMRFDTRNPSKPRLAETLDALPTKGEQITAIAYQLGGGTLLVGDSAGNVHAWTSSKPHNAPTPDGVVLASSHQFAFGGGPVTSLAVSSRNRMAAVGTAAGKFGVIYVTSDRILAAEQPDGGGPIAALAIAPRDNGILVLNPAGFSNWNLDAAYPEISLSTLFRPVWYEGYPRPTHSWQTSSGSDAFEPKFGLWPLIFGTLKATFYSMLFGAPLALMAALYTSEFLNPRLRAKIKPTVEIMASLPSVVLGFIAGLVIAPAVESIVPSILASLFAVPATLLLVAHLWQLLPIEWSVRLARFRIILIIFVVPLGVVLGSLAGPTIERVLFGGDLNAWLNGRVGTGTPGWFVLLLPLCALLTAWLMATYVRPRLRELSANWSRLQAAGVELGRFLAACLLTLLIAWLAGVFLNEVSLDPRGLVLGTYVQRNALIVGFMMGFAIIPLIYTIADDALSAVPTHLRSASLGAGATPWQTAVRIIIPTAMSGLFSAVMIGLGRAVGETMIVLMAAGNTPIMDMNIFNGFQTLSATIATEMPEAAASSTHYRTLFLAALALFMMTFVVNSIAEVIRLRFRRRAYEL